MTVSITIPSGTANAVGNPRTICASGEATAGGASAQSAYAKVYPASGTPPSEPPSGLIGSPMIDADFLVTEIPVDSCGTSSPYPQGKLRVWVEFDDDTWQHADVVVDIVCADESDCGGIIPPG